jgi:hypothetical protein
VGPNHPPKALFREESGRGLKFNTKIYQAPGLKKSGALLQLTFCAFMTWIGVNMHLCLRETTNVYLSPVSVLVLQLLQLINAVFVIFFTKLPCFEIKFRFVL